MLCDLFSTITTSSVTNRTLTFIYGPEHQRIAQRTQLDSTAPANMSASAGTVYYLHGQNNNLSYEKEVKDNGLIEHKHDLSAGGIVFAMQVTRTGNTATGGVSGSAKPTQSLTYMHHDHLGSVSVLTDDSSSVIERLAYDPWGKRRFPNGTADTSDSIVGLTLDRGFTMHEHLDEMGVIHMNGRIYDPLIGRFMSADPFIPDASNLQAHNRFAYVYNNPLKFTDPDGFKPFWRKKWFKVLAGIAVGWWTGGAVMNAIISLPGVPNFALAAIGGVAGGFVGGVIAGDSFKAGLQGAFSGGIFGAIGGAGATGNWNPAQYVAAHAAGGCITSVASGGGCGSGAVAAAFGKFATIYGPDWVKRPDGFVQVTAGASYAAIIGGVGSVLGGGKFSNGAETAAFAYLFNQAMTELEKQRRAGYRSQQAAFRRFARNEDVDPNAPTPHAQGVLQVGASGAILMGASTAVGVARDTAGNRACVVETCFLIGPVLGSSVDAGGQGSMGTISQTGWSVSGFGKFALPLMGGEVNLGYGSDGLLLGGSGSTGAMAGGGLKICTSSVVKIDVSICK